MKGDKEIFRNPDNDQDKLKIDLSPSSTCIKLIKYGRR